ncbi:MAG: glutamine-hydrolyzing carbamoyl-phosphate synthase small subunit [Clostridiales bacterium]|nr:glutamine-hydrolyzing carbamoyl-phosphate synthase small subunit [Clostridiales bacterium]
MEGLLLLEDGSLYRGQGFGAAATQVGELVFNTAMTGYQGALTDPSYKGQVINMTYPLIGNYGVSEVDNQSERIHAFGLVTRDISFRPSNRMCVMTISEWLEQQGVPGVYNVDTRAITKRVRAEGTIKCVISTEGIPREEAAERMKDTPLRTDYMREVGTRELQIISPSEQTTTTSAPRVAVLDFGIKRGIINSLAKRGCEVWLFPYGTTAEEILAAKPDGLFLSNGPGDPEACTAGIETTRALLDRLPVFGICMGHQVIALAAGARTYKLKFGHRGANHGVIDLETGRSAITSQNHSFAVDPDSVRTAGMAVTHLNLNDGTVEGIRHESLPVFSVQYHPEGSPGPTDSRGLFDRFVSIMGKGGERNA